MDTNPTGTTPLTTGGEVTGTQGQESADSRVARLQSELELAQRERDEAKEMALRANRAAEAGKKFEKFEEFQTTVLGKLTTLETGMSAKDKEIADLKEILVTRNAETPSVSTAPSSTTPSIPDSVKEQRIKGMFGLPTTS